MAAAQVHGIVGRSFEQRAWMRFVFLQPASFRKMNHFASHHLWHQEESETQVLLIIRQGLG